MDQNVHASIVDGAILSKANVRFFRHNRPDDLEKKLSGTSGKQLVIVEGVYSMDGDVARLPEIVEVAKRHGARIMIDEAHSTFLYGENGRGVAEKYGLEEDIDIHVGHVLEGARRHGRLRRGLAGAVQLPHGLRALARLLLRALAGGLGRRAAGAAHRASANPQLRAKLWNNVAYMRGLLAEAGIDVGESTSQIIPIMIRNDRKIFGVAQALQRAGLYLQPIIYPAVAKHRSRFRISISATHTDAAARRGGHDPERRPAGRGTCDERRGARPTPEFVQYHFRHAIGGFFEFPTENARRILPPHLQPVEPHHGQSVLSVMAFDFHKSMVGEYGELILSVLVMPRVEPGAPLPRSAFYPFLLGTTTKASREHAIERWHLPHFMDDIDLAFDARGRRRSGSPRRTAASRSSTCGSPTTTGSRSRTATSRFMHDEHGSYMSTIIMDAGFSENEEERGEHHDPRARVHVRHRPRRREHDAVPRALDARRPADVPPARDAGLRGGLMAGRVCVIVNPAAGRGRGARTLPAVRAAFAAVGRGRRADHRGARRRTRRRAAGDRRGIHHARRGRRRRHVGQRRERDRRVGSRRAGSR